MKLAIKIKMVMDSVKIQKGNEFKINFLASNGSETSEPLTKFYIQSWKDIGLKVELVDGRLHEFNAMREMIKKR